MKRTRHILAMTLMATALCADRMATAAPEIRFHLQVASDPIARLATKLSLRFCRVVPAVRLHQARREGPMNVSPGEPPIVLSVVVYHVEGSPFQFRLPPPCV